LHVGIAASVASIKKLPARRGATSISVHAPKKKPEPAKVTPKEEPRAIAKADVPAPAKKAAPPPPKAAAAIPPPVSFAAAEAPMYAGNFGNGAGIAVPSGPAAAKVAEPVASAAPKVLVA